MTAQFKDKDILYYILFRTNSMQMNATYMNIGCIDASCTEYGWSLWSSSRTVFRSAHDPGHDCVLTKDKWMSIMCSEVLWVLTIIGQMHWLGLFMVWSLVKFSVSNLFYIGSQSSNNTPFYASCMHCGSWRRHEPVPTDFGQKVKFTWAGRQSTVSQC